MMQCSPERVDIRARIGLGSAILLGRRISRASVKRRVFRCSCLESTRNTEVDEANRIVGGDHYIRRLEIAEYDGGILTVQICQGISQIRSPFDHLAERERPAVRPV